MVKHIKQIRISKDIIIYLNDLEHQTNILNQTKYWSRSNCILEVYHIAKTIVVNKIMYGLCDDDLLFDLIKKHTSCEKYKVKWSN